MTSWGKEATWYADHVEDLDSYHEKVLLPNILRLVKPRNGMHLFEIGCGEGFFARSIASEGARVMGADIAPELIKIAKERDPRSTYLVRSADMLRDVPERHFDIVLAVLTLQNMAEIEPVFKEAKRILKAEGKLILVLNHPAFRIPKMSSWGYDEECSVQYRRMDAYLSARSQKIDMHPGATTKKSYTYSFHRSLQDYMKALRTAHFQIRSLEEWISHRTSERGPRKEAEDRARKEFPLFLMLECVTE